MTLEEELFERYGSNPKVKIFTDTDGCKNCLSVVVGECLVVWVCPENPETGSFNTTLDEAIEEIETELKRL